MTNEELLEDLKQFIDARFSQEMVHVATKEDINRLDVKLERVQEAIADTLTKAVEAVDTTEKVEDHERRLTRLERRAA